MFDKWIIRAPDSNASIVVKRDDRDKNVVVGGHKSFMNMAEHIVETYIGRDVPENTHTQRSRFRYILEDVRIEQWRNALRMLSDDYIAERVQRHGRII